MRTCSGSAPWDFAARPWRASVRSRTPALPAACPARRRREIIENRGGAISDPQAAAGNIGTTVEVRNLFFNTPARRKFLKGSPTEFGHISEMVLRTALPYPNVGFELTPPDGRCWSCRRRSFMSGCWRRGRMSFASSDCRWMSAMPRFRSTGSLACRIWRGRRRSISTLTSMAGTSATSFCQHALREAYRGLTEPGRHPAAILLISMPPQDVDVNVHPTKIEVRFSDSGRLHGLVLAEIREKLLGNDLTPPAFVPSRAAARCRRRRMSGGGRSWPTSSASNSRRRPRRCASSDGSRRQAVSSTHRSATQGVMPLPAGAAPVRGSDHDRAGGGRGSAAPQVHRRSSCTTATSSPTDGDGLGDHRSACAARADHVRGAARRVSRGAAGITAAAHPRAGQGHRVADGAAGADSAAAGKLGIEVSASGPSTVAVQAFPSFLDRIEPGGVRQELLETGEQELLDLHEEELLHDVLDMMACKAAVKAGDPLTPAEIEALIARRAWWIGPATARTAGRRR